MKNPADRFRDEPCVSARKESLIKSNTMMSCSLQKKKEFIFSKIYFVQSKFFKNYLISMYRVLNKLSEYISFYISKNIASYTFVACFKNRRIPSVYS